MELKALLDATRGHKGDTKILIPVVEDTSDNEEKIEYISVGALRYDPDKQALVLIPDMVVQVVL